MRTVKHEPGPFPIETGMCLINPNLPLADGSYSSVPNWHPFVVVETSEQEGEPWVTMVMARTLHDRSKLDRFQSALEITNPRPPMDGAKFRPQYTDTANVIRIPEKELFHGGTEHCAVYGDKLADFQTQAIQEAVKENAKSPWATLTDVPKLRDTFKPRPKADRTVQDDKQTYRSGDQSLFDNTQKSTKIQGRIWGTGTRPVPDIAAPPDEHTLSSPVDD